MTARTKAATAPADAATPASPEGAAPPVPSTPAEETTAPATDPELRDRFAEIRKYIDRELEAMHRKFGQFADLIGPKIDALEQAVAGVRQRLEDNPELSSKVAAIARQVDDLQSALSRTGSAIGRGDLVNPPATADQITELIEAGGGVLTVLADYKIPGFKRRATEELDTRLYPRAVIVDGVRSGKFKVSIKKRHSKE